MKSKSIIVPLVLAMLAISPMAYGRLTQKAAIDTIVANSLRLKSLKAKGQAEYESAAYGAGLIADPEVEFEHLWGPYDNRKWNIGITQSFDWPGAYGKRKAAARAAHEAWSYLYSAEAADLRINAAEALALATYSAQRLALLDSVCANMEKLQAYIDNGYRSGQLTILDVKKISLELFSVRAKIADIRQEQNTVESELTALNNGMPLDVETDSYMASPLLDRDVYMAYARDNNPRVNAQAAQSRAARAESEAMKTSRMPGFSVGYRHAFEEEIHFNGLAVGVTLPVYSRARALKAADLQIQSALFEASAETVSAQSLIASEYDNAVNRRNQLEGLSAVTLDESYPSLLLMAYKGGQINVITYIQELNYYLDARFDYLDAEYRYRLSLIRLNRYNPAE